jgi:putative transcriptional regulator
VRFFVGYSGWGEGQLDAEVDEGAWIVLEGAPDLVFADGDDALWRQILRQMGGEYALLSTFPDDPRLN